jgi:hypothetical protein
MRRGRVHCATWHRVGAQLEREARKYRQRIERGQSLVRAAVQPRATAAAQRQARGGGPGAVEPSAATHRPRGSVAACRVGLGSPPFDSSSVRRPICLRMQLKYRPSGFRLQCSLAVMQVRKEKELRRFDLFQEMGKGNGRHELESRRTLA